MKRIGSCPSIVESAAFVTDSLLLSDFQQDLDQLAADPGLPPVFEDEDQIMSSATCSPAAAKRGPGRPTKHIGLSAKERKERRLVSNRLAARRAYYRRTEKLSTLQNENKTLVESVQKKDAEIAQLKELVRKCGFDPDQVLKSVNVKQAAGGRPKKGAKRPTLTDYMGGMKMSEDEPAHAAMSVPANVGVLMQTAPLSAPASIGLGPDDYNMDMFNNGGNGIGAMSFLDHAGELPRASMSTDFESFESSTDSLTGVRSAAAAAASLRPLPPLGRCLDCCHRLPPEI